MQNKDIKLHSTHNEGKFAVAKRFKRTLKNKIYKCITSDSKNMYIGKQDEIISKYKNTYHRTNIMKPADQTHILILLKNKNWKGQEFKIDDMVRITK